MRFLIVKSSALGDIIHAYPVLQYLKERLPDCQIDWVVEKRNAGLIKAHPLISNALEIDTSSWRKNWWKKETYKSLLDAFRAIRNTEYDAVFDLQSNVKSAIITKFCRAKSKVGFGYKTAHEKVSSLVLTHRYNPAKGINIRNDYLFIVQSYLQDFSEPTTHTLLKLTEPSLALEPSWMICPGSNWQNKQLTKEQLLSFLTLCHQGYSPRFVFLCGSSHEEVLAKELAAHFPNATYLSRPSLAQLQHLMSKMQLVISMDSLPLHLAATANCPTFSFFGPSSASKFAPTGSIHASFQGTCPYGKTFEKRCPILRTCKTGACLREPNGEALFKAFSRWFSK